MTQPLRTGSPSKVRSVFTPISPAVPPRPVVFSDLGGAGVTMINGTVTKTLKGVGVFSASQINARASFQTQFLTELRRSRYGDAAFCPLVKVS
jgi:hypothetical protein